MTDFLPERMMALDDPASPLTYAPGTRRDAHALVLAHTQLVRRIAWHVLGRASAGTELADLIQIGMVALVEAANGYEDRGHAFATYATVRVRGAMIDQLRRQATITRSAMSRRREIEAARKAFAAREGRVPGDAELAAALEMSADELRAALRDCEAVSFESIDDLYSDHSPWFADQSEGADEAMDREAMTALLASAIETLPEREAMILQLYFIEELNLHEIGETLGIGAARVCQIKKAALGKLRGVLGERG